MPSYTTNGNPTDVVLGDLNGDGLDDAVVWNASSNTISIFFGRADGALTARGSFAASSFFGLIDLGDFNNDGRLDLLTSRDVLLGNGDGSFQSPIAYVGASTPFGLAAGDFNGDGISDFVSSASSGGPAGLRIGLGVGDGTFVMSDLARAGSGGSIQVVDINGDGVLDIAARSVSGNAYRVDTYLGDGHGAFQATPGFIAGSNYESTLGDLNGDGRADLVTNTRTLLTISLSNGDGTFQTVASYNIPFIETPSDPPPYPVPRIGDFNHDGIADLALGRYSNASLPSGISMYLGRGNGTFMEPVFYETENITALELGDTNGDGSLDFLWLTREVRVGVQVPGTLTVRTDFSGRVVTGGPGNDFVTGTIGPDILIGNAGGDLINGLFGADMMSGGQGDDLYVVDHISDIVTELSGEGRDVIQSSVSYTISAGGDIEVLTTDNQAGTGRIDFTGNALDNALYGNDGVNLLNGGDGADYIMAYGGNDFLVGGGGDDILVGGAGNDDIRGGAGDDYLVGGDGARDLLEGLDGNDILIGNWSNYGDAGNDLIYGGFGYGGAGNDSYYGSYNVHDYVGGGFDYYYATFDFVLGEGSNFEIEMLAPRYFGDVSALRITGNSFAQGIYGNEGSNVLDGRGGDDYLVGMGGHDLLVGGDGGDVIDGGQGDDQLNGDAGADYLVGGLGNDILDGGSATDQMFGSLGDDNFVVDEASDRVVELAGEGFDRVTATNSYTLHSAAEIEMLIAASGAGSITLSGNDFANSVYGNDSANVLSGGGGDDYLVGDAGDDTLHGDAGVDAISGGLGHDTINGGDGDDYLVGGLGNDILSGGAGADSFLFDTVPDLFANIDRVMAFTVAQDRLLLDDAIYSGLSAGKVSANAFRTGTAAADADDRVIYDPATGFLYYDSDGSGGGAAVQFATLDTGLALSASDLWVV